MTKGNISVNSENIFPIIKKWLYSDKDIFLRELVSNGCDAVTKMKKLVGIGEADAAGDENYRIDVTLDENAGTLKISDNGIGMTAEEIDKYITQIAFSGANDFLEKYKDEKNPDQIIGHFGLGFYSAFMVADKVEIDSLSYQKGAKAAKWVCDGGLEYELGDGERATRGTDITLYLGEDGKEFKSEYAIRSILNKYCAFLPVEVYLNTVGKDNEEKKDEKDDKAPEEPKPVNDTNPLWMKKPSDCTDDEYKQFYTKVFMDFNEPLFWVHLNVDFPFRLKGILYFPKINHEFTVNEGQIKLFNNQVFVADNVKEVIPEFLMLLKGVIDCPDLPLNVSRSFLQNDGYVKKIQAHITKKVADKLLGIFKKERESFNKYWDDINIFIKYGCMRDEKFYEKVKDIIIYKTTDGEYVTLNDYIGDKENKDVYYTSDKNQQSQYIKLFNEQGIKVLELSTMMDTQFMSFEEMKNEGVKFKRVDSNASDLADSADSQSDEDVNKLSEIMKASVPEGTKIEVKALKNSSIPAVMLLGEESRRMQEMYRAYGQQMAAMAGMFKDEYTLVLNSSNALIKKLPDLSDDDARMVCDNIYDLAMLCNKPLPAEQMTKFIERSNMIMQKLADMK